jgi:hypothetical protein
MKAINAALGAIGFSAVVAAAGYLHTSSFAANSGVKAGAATNANGNLHVPGAYRTTYEFLGTWAVAADKDPAQKSFMSSMPRPEPLPPIARTDIFLTARCW